MMMGLWDFTWALYSMFSKLLRGRWPTEPYGVAMLVILTLAIGAAVVLVVAPLFDAWLTTQIDRTLQ